MHHAQGGKGGYHASLDTAFSVYQQHLKAHKLDDTAHSLQLLCLHPACIDLMLIHSGLTYVLPRFTKLDDTLSLDSAIVMNQQQGGHPCTASTCRAHLVSSQLDSSQSVNATSETYADFNLWQNGCPLTAMHVSAVHAPQPLPLSTALPHE